MAGFSVDLEALTAAGEGITELVDMLARQDIDDIDCDKAAVGHGGLADRLESFCDRWQIGVTNLMKDGTEVAGRLRAAANLYRTSDAAGAQAIGGVITGG